MSTITAISTPAGTGGIAIIRLSGPDALSIADKVWAGVKLSSVVSHTAHLGKFINSDGSILDNAVATVFRAPNSFTGEDTVEFSVHGSRWIQRQVVELLVQHGAEPAEGGEFTRRAFINGRLDLAQAEAVADLIEASSKASHRLAMTQMNGQFSKKLNQLRDNLVQLASLLELELDFSEEDVEFADRQRLGYLADDTIKFIEQLTATYKTGKALKEGVPVVIAGAPNVGKSTLLNRLLDEDKAIVSDIPGTTRDVIEDTHEIGGVMFRFFDTAGLRPTDDMVENIGIERARNTIERASIILHIIDPTDDINNHGISDLSDLTDISAHSEYSVKADNGQIIILLINKTDRLDEVYADNIIRQVKKTFKGRILPISAKTGKGIDKLKELLIDAVSDHNPDTELIITNARHQQALIAGAESLKRARQGIEEGLSADFIAQDVREALHHLGTVTGAVTTDTLLSTIFARFCIGK